MGIPRAVCRLLIDEHIRRPFTGSLLQLGRKDILFTEAEMNGWAAEQGATLSPPLASRVSSKPHLAAHGCMNDRSFFETLGFSDIKCLDFSDYEGADLVFDLNEPLPSHLRGQFDVVLESGTLQHLFHLPNVMANIHALLKPGGRVIHGMAASNNHVDHGYYMFSPSFFHEYYLANRYRIETIRFMEFFTYWKRGLPLYDRWPIYEYTPGCLDHLSYGGYGHQQAAIFCVATRTPEASGEVRPQQAVYESLWASHGREPDKAPKAADRNGIGARIKWLVHAYPTLERLYLPLNRLRYQLRRILPRTGMPRIVARY